MIWGLICAFFGFKNCSHRQSHGCLSKRCRLNRSLSLSLATNFWASLVQDFGRTELDFRAGWCRILSLYSYIFILW